MCQRALVTTTALSPKDRPSTSRMEADYSSIDEVRKIGELPDDWLLIEIVVLRKDQRGVWILIYV